MSRPHKALPSTLCDLCNCKVWWAKRELVALLNLFSWCLVMLERLFLAVPWGCLRFVIVVFPDHTYFFWSCYSQLLRRCIKKKIHYLTLTPRSRGSRSHKMLPSTLDFMWPMHQQSLMLLHPMVEEKMYLQENTLFDLHGHTKCCPAPSTLCDLCTNKVLYCYIPRLRRRCIYKKIHYLTLTFWVKVTQNVAQCPIHHVTYAHTEFEVTTSKGLGKKIQYSICCPVPSTSCDLSSYKVWSCFV